MNINQKWGEKMKLIYITVPPKYFHQKNNRIRKKWIKKYGKIKIYEVTGVRPVHVSGDLPCDIPFTGRLNMTAELAEMAEKMAQPLKELYYQRRGHMIPK